eukprot:15481367-Alexandrium_andersonii.AAC.1
MRGVQASRRAVFSCGKGGVLLRSQDERHRFRRAEEEGSFGPFTDAGLAVPESRVVGVANVESPQEIVSEAPPTGTRTGSGESRARALVAKLGCRGSRQSPTFRWLRPSHPVPAPPSEPPIQAWIETSGRGTRVGNGMGTRTLFV